MSDLRKAAEDALHELERLVPKDDWAITVTLRAALEQEKKWDLIREMHNVEEQAMTDRRAALDEVHQSMHEEYHGTMRREDIIRLAREAGASPLHGGEVALFGAAAIERFAALVAATEREAMEDIILDYAERDDLSDSDESLLKHLLELIRARGEV